MSAEVAVDQVQLKEDIAAAKAEENAAKTKVEELQAQLPPNEAFMTHTELGFIKTDGNTNTETFMLEIDLRKGWGAHSLAFDFDGQYAEDNGVESKNKFWTSVEYAYAITHRLSGIYISGYKQDKFSGFNSQSFTGAGARYLTVETKNHYLTLEADLLYSHDDIEDIHYDATGKEIDYPNGDNIATATTLPGYERSYGSYRAKLDYKWQVFSNLKFNQELSYRAEIRDNHNYFVYSKTALTTKISDIFSAGASYKVDYVNTPPGDKEYTDSTFTLNLIVDY